MFYSTGQVDFGGTYNDDGGYRQQQRRNAAQDGQRVPCGCQRERHNEHNVPRQRRHHEKVGVDGVAPRTTAPVGWVGRGGGLV